MGALQPHTFGVDKLQMQDMRLVDKQSSKIFPAGYSIVKLCFACYPAN